MDDGEPIHLSSTTRVLISVKDMNDNAPEFDQKTYNVEIPSNAVIDQRLFQVNYTIIIRDYSLTMWLCLCMQSLRERGWVIIIRREG